MLIFDKSISVWQRQLYKQNNTFFGTCQLNKIQKLDLGLLVFPNYIVRFIKCYGAVHLVTTYFGQWLCMHQIGNQNF
jgi:hypothetical protein